MKRKIFVGSSSESSGIVAQLCDATNGKHSDQLELVPWISAFDLSAEVLQSLLATFRDYDGAVFVITHRDEPRVLPPSVEANRDSLYQCNSASQVQAIEPVKDDFQDKDIPFNQEAA